MTLVRRARRSELGAIFALVQQYDGSRLSPQQIMERATSYGYWVAESNLQWVGAAGLLLTSSVACVRDLAVNEASPANAAVEVLLDTLQQEAANMACEVLLLDLPAAGTSLESLLRERHYERMPLAQMKTYWREVAAEHFPEQPALWVYHLRALEP